MGRKAEEKLRSPASPTSRSRSCSSADCHGVLRLMQSPASITLIPLWGPCASEFYADPQGYRTIVIDTLDAFEAILIDWTCFRNNWKTIESPPFGKGWVAADDTWRNFLRALIAIRDRHNTTIILVCHASIERIDDPRCASFTSYAPKLHRRARGLVADVADAIFFLSEDLRVVTDDRDRNRGAASTDRYLFCQGRPSFMAKNRFGIPEKVPLPVNANFSDIARYWANPTE